jgi:Family of unknown function (DUF6010)
MSPQSQTELSLPILLSPIGVAIVIIALCSLLKEPQRQQFSAIFLAGAGAAYLSSGFGLWEFGFCATITLLAYQGLQRYRAIAIGWVLHSAWDIAHHHYGNPIIPFAATSSIGCAVCDLVLAAWYGMGAPQLFRRRPLSTKAP